MAQNHVQEGKVLTVTNGTGADIVSGEAFLVGSILAVALGDIADGAQGEAAVDEVWNLPYDGAGAVGEGVLLYWDDTAKALTLTSTDNTLAGVAAAAGADASASVNILINK